jgi:hypothetical protein
MFSIDLTNKKFKMATLSSDSTTPDSILGDLTNPPVDFSAFNNIGLYVDGVPAYFPSCS